MSEQEAARNERAPSRGQVELDARPRDEDATGVSRPEQAPVLRIVTPDTTPEEVAAIVAVLSALGGGEAPAPRRTPEWNRPARLTRATHRHGVGGWRSSALPR